MNALSTKRNNYLENEKESRIFTPPPICKFLFDIISPEIKKKPIIFDPAIGTGNLPEPWENAFRIGNDIITPEIDWLDSSLKSDFLDWNHNDFFPVDLVLCNPPYNHSSGSRKKHGKTKLLPELFAERVFSIFGVDTPLVLFAPMGLRLNQRCYKTTQGRRYKSMRENMGKITSIVSLPLDSFQNPNFNPDIPEAVRNPKKGILKSNLKRIETQQEIIIFNLPKIDPHYFLPENVIDEIRIYDEKSQYEKTVDKK